MACSSICPSSSPTFGPNTARRCQAGTARPRYATPRTTVARLTGAITALMQRDRTHHRRKVSFTSGARTAHAAILPLDRGRVSRVGDAGSPAPYSCPCLTPVSARPSPAMPLAPTPSHTPPSERPRPARCPALPCADDRRRDRASAVVGDASSRRLCSPCSRPEAAANPCPVCAPRRAGRGTHDAACCLISKSAFG